VHEVKIDKSFVSTMDSDRQNASIVRSVIDLGNDLGMRVVAEGVETAAVLARLEQLGCDVAQGFFVAPPMPLADVARWARAYGGRRWSGRCPSST
jgi:EAL domain-containing protein (putative c-di-GMP-specific phosphodiesterase class I)